MKSEFNEINEESEKDSNSEKGIKILVIEDDPGMRAQLRWAMSELELSFAGNCDDGLAVFEEEKPRVVLLDLGLPPHASDATEGMRFLKTALASRPRTKIIVTSGNGDHATALEAIAHGAYDICPKPVDPHILKIVIQRALNLYQLEEEVELLRDAQQSEPLAGLIAGSPEMLKICHMIERVASSNVGILITGESGTGKDLVARAIHRLSSRKDQPFIAINCAAIPENLLESELFGHERGSFTGAIKQAIGKIECANHGTLFLDEIGDMAPALQAKLLRFLQDKTIVRVGGHKPIDVDLRVIAATNQDLKILMAEGRFREDLFYRLNEIGLRIPPLRERAGDALLIAQHLLKKHSNVLNRRVSGFTAEAVALIEAHPWPGNIRELENRIKRAVVMAEGKFIGAVDLELSTESLSQASAYNTLRAIREDSERKAVIRALALTDNNVSQAAKMLAISRPTLYGLLKTLHIVRGDQL
jgi:two-component system NtrC family response regulator